MVEVRALGGFQYFCPGFVVSHGNPFILDVNVPVTLDGMAVQPGDLLHGDANGVLVVPDGVADQVARRRNGCAPPSAKYSSSSGRRG